MPTKAELANIVVELMDYLNPAQYEDHRELYLKAIKTLEPDINKEAIALMIRGESWYTPDFDEEELKDEDDLDFDDYQKQAMETAQYDNSQIKLLESIRDFSQTPILYEEINNIIKTLRLFYVTTGLIGEAGEVAEKFKKVFRNDDGKLNEVSVKAISKELGDNLWYIAAFASELGLSLKDIAKDNLDKLSKRDKLELIKSSGDDREEK